MNDAGSCTVTVDGRALKARSGEPLTETLSRAETYVPHLCYHPDLGALQTCDTCWVECDGHLVRSCSLTARDGLALSVDAPSARRARVEGMNRVLHKHELYCTLCDNNNGDCEIHDAVDRLRLRHQAYAFETKPYPPDHSNPFYSYDPSQCILCGRCVEACQNVQVNETLTIDWDAEYPRVLWDGGRPINESSCVSCGHCVTVCPCNALMEKSLMHRAGPFTGWSDDLKRPMIDFVKSIEPSTTFLPITALSKADQCLRHQEHRVSKSVCTFCGVGCSFQVWTRGRDLLKIQPVAEGPANGISTCVKGKFGWDFVNSPDRLTQPLIRDGDRFREASWDEAYDLIHRRLSAIRDRHGPDALGFIATSKGSNEEAYLTQKFARAVIGTNNIDCTSRYCQSPATMGLTRTVGYAGDSGTLADIQEAGLVILIGTNTTDSHPVLAARLKRQKKLRGMKIVVFDLLRHEMAERADLYIRPRAGTDFVYLSAISRYILDQGMEDRVFLEQRVNGLDAYRASLAPYTLDFAEAETGIPGDTLKRVAEMIVQARGVCALWAMGVTQRTTGTDTSTAISNLLLTTGNYGKRGSGAYPLRGHNNVQGAGDFGALCDQLPGYQKVEDATARARVGAVWGVTLPSRKGLNNHTMMDAIYAQKLRGLYIIGEDSAVVDAHTSHTQGALEQLEFLVVQDIFLTTTARFADVVLPACPVLEKEGTFVNTERRIQRFEPAMEPLGNARPDWRILTDLAQRFGHAWNYRGPSDIMDEIARVAPLLGGVHYDRLQGFDSLCWPAPADGSTESLLYTERFHTEDGKATLFPLQWHAPVEQPDGEYDLLLNNGRVLEHFQEGNLTGRVPGLVSKVPELYVEVSPVLAAERGLETGSLVRLKSRRGAIDAKVFVSDRVAERELYTSEFSLAEPINRLTGNHADAVVSTPAFKELAVKMELLVRSGSSPLPRSNPRFGARTPQSGVDVERKWARRDYNQPSPGPARPEAG